MTDTPDPRGDRLAAQKDSHQAMQGLAEVGHANEDFSQIGFSEWLSREANGFGNAIAGSLGAAIRTDLPGVLPPLRITEGAQGDADCDPEIGGYGEYGHEFGGGDPGDVDMAAYKDKMDPYKDKMDPDKAVILKKEKAAELEGQDADGSQGPVCTDQDAPAAEAGSYKLKKYKATH